MSAKKTTKQTSKPSTNNVPPPAPAADVTTEARLAVLEEELVHKDEEIADLRAIVAKLSKTAEKKPSKVSNLKPLKVGKKLYRFAIPAVFFEGKKVTAEDVSDNPDLAARLIAVNSAMLVEQ